MTHHARDITLYARDITLLLPLARDAAVRLGVEQTRTGKGLGHAGGRVAARTADPSALSCALHEPRKPDA